MPGPGGRPLSEVSPMERRRNSPSFNQATKKMMHNGDSSPFDTSPFGASISPRLFWQERDPCSPSRSSIENRNPYDSRDSSPSLAKRKSIENLKRASRVKNSNMFAREHKQDYDPSRVPLIERPLAAGRPLSMQNLANFSRNQGSEKVSLLNDSINGATAGKMLPPSSPTKFPPPARSDGSQSPSKEQGSPFKSSLSRRSRFTLTMPNSGFDPERGVWSEDEDLTNVSSQSLHRYAKSVTFDAAPPQVNEYEQPTPDPSSVASGSREGSYSSMEDEEEDISFDLSMDHEDSFDASLEDTEKTPVVLPEDWRFMSPSAANDDLAHNADDVFEREEGSPAPTAIPTLPANAPPAPLRTDSANSSGERRPLPPVPGIHPFRRRSDSANSSTLSATADRLSRSSTPRLLPTPPPASSISKDELQGIGASDMSLEDRLKLLVLQEEENSQNQESLREQRIRGGGSSEKSVEKEDENGSGIQIYEDCQEEARQEESQEESQEDITQENETEESRPRISRDSILRKVKSQNQYFDDYSSPFSSPEHLYDGSGYDPDVPLPSLEDETSYVDDEEDESSVIIKQEEDDEIDVYAIPDLYSQHQEQTAMLDKHLSQTLDFSMLQSSNPQDGKDGEDEEGDDDDASHYSSPSTAEKEDVMSNLDETSSGQSTPRPASVLEPPQSPKGGQRGPRMSVTEFASLLGDAQEFNHNDFSHGLGSFMSSESDAKNSIPETEARKSIPDPEISNKIAAIRRSLQRSPTPEEDELKIPKARQQEQEQDAGQDEESEPHTPESVIRHSFEESPRHESPAIPERQATIKAPGSGLKTRPSLTPADTATMAATRRIVSGERYAVPPIPDRHRDRPSLSLPAEEDSESTDESSSDNNSGSALTVPSEIGVQRKTSLVQLDIPLGNNDEGLGMGLDKEFDRVIEAQKMAFDASFSQLDSSSSQLGSPGAEYGGFSPQNSTPTRKQPRYLMRQNTKVVVASSRNIPDLDSEEIDAANRGTRSAGPSPRKPSQTTWTTEPWNGKMRRRSIRQASGTRQRKRQSGPQPPLPGQQSNVLENVGENDATSSGDEFEDGEERGRLFVKVVGVKDLELPLPKRERSYFALTLDNGLHCVTTSWLELGKNAPIGQEFELVVLEDLEFQLTLQTKLEEPKRHPVVNHSPTKSPKAPRQSTFSKVFSSPRKRKELELRHQLEAQQIAQKQAQARNVMSEPPTAWELQHKLVAKDGSFARAYVSLKDHEQQSFGRPYTVDIPCFNEWATEDASSVKSKRSATNVGYQRRPPYKIGKLELQLLFVPKPKGAKDEDMPKSMNGCLRELKEAEAASSRTWEGYLSQQGGDCPYWRRRFFKLAGSKLTAYHESTLQPRATINLAKVVKVIDDKSSLIQKEASAKGGGRRKSAFAEEEEGYMFVEEGFRIRFANGETIDFYADSAAQKDEWMKVLGDAIGKDSKSVKGWTDLVLAKEKAQAARHQHQVSRRASTSPSKVAAVGRKAVHKHTHSQPMNAAPPPLEKDARHQNPEHTTRRADMPQTRSMIF
ncbi:MAG: Bud site selection protein bud4 [Cirrosporium novae-zelandiae]|nr:MAG: Bud site selection protein bud4 [Cirrosporium novae-zelandiae]